jgi:hypothetical protein
MKQKANELNLDWLAYSWKHDSNAAILQVFAIEARLLAMNRDKNSWVDFPCDV